MAYIGSLEKCVLYAGGRWAADHSELILIARCSTKKHHFAIPAGQTTDDLPAKCCSDHQSIFYGDIKQFTALVSAASRQITMFGVRSVQTPDK